MQNPSKPRPELQLIKELGLDGDMFQSEQQRIADARQIENERRRRWESSLSRLALQKEGRDLREILELFIIQDVYDDNEKKMYVNEGQRSLAKFLLSMMEAKNVKPA